MNDDGNVIKNLYFFFRSQKRQVHINREVFMSIIDIMKTVDMMNFGIFYLSLLLCSHCLSPATAAAAVLKLSKIIGSAH